MTISYQVGSALHVLVFRSSSYNDHFLVDFVKRTYKLLMLNTSSLSFIWFCPYSSEVFHCLIFLGKPASIYDTTNPDWAPSQKLGYNYQGVSESSQKRHERSKERVEKRRRSDCASALLELSNQSTEQMSHSNALPDVEEYRSKDCQTEIFLFVLRLNYNIFCPKQVQNNLLTA